MLLNKFMRQVIIITLLNFSGLFAQDSLYLITTFTGQSLDEPIYQVNRLGDLNGDGFDELVIKIYKTNYFNIYFGSDIFSSQNIYSLFNPIDSFSIGSDLGVPIGDVNKDGYDDFLLTIHDINSYYRANVLIFFGGEEINNEPDFLYEGKLDSVEYLSAQTGGDVNSDGYNDFIITSYWHPENTEGKSYLFMGAEEIADTPYVTFFGDATENSFGASADIRGDINGDGFDDVLIEARYSLGAYNSKLYIYYGGQEIINIPDTILTFKAHSTYLYVGDYNGDGFDDFFVTHENKLFFGSDNFTADNFLTFSGSDETVSFGFNAGSVGDINNDGYDDLIIGDKTYENSEGIQLGAAYIYLGSASPDTIPDFSFKGETELSFFGTSVGSCGDLNGDGYNEIYILADLYPDPYNYLGKVYIYSMKKFVVSVEEEKTEIPQSFKLHQNYPNPFNPTTTIKYEIPSSSVIANKVKQSQEITSVNSFLRNDNVKLIVYDVLGREIKTLLNENKEPGSYEVKFDARELSSGVYFYKLQSRDFIQTRKMILLH